MEARAFVHSTPRIPFRFDLTLWSMSQSPLRFASNPLPGMNPWLEKRWGDMHTRLTMYACDYIAKQLPPGLQALIEEYLAVEDSSEYPSTERRIAPDIYVSAVHATYSVGSQPAVAPVSIANEPIRFQRLNEPITLRSIRIFDRESEKNVVTAIEFISPANKVAPGIEQYLRKQNELISAGVNLVEIDLLRKGHWIIAADRDAYPAKYTEPYRVCVVRASDNQAGEAYEATYSKPLPTIRIPLRPTDNDVFLPLQSILNEAYISGSRGNLIDYNQPPIPPLDENDAKVVQTLLESMTSTLTSNVQ
jgi:hypothetical protein